MHFLQENTRDCIKNLNMHQRGFWMLCLGQLECCWKMKNEVLFRSSCISKPCLATFQRQTTYSKNLNNISVHDSWQCALSQAMVSEMLLYWKALKAFRRCLVWWMRIVCLTAFRLYTESLWSQRFVTQTSEFEGINQISLSLHLGRKERAKEQPAARSLRFAITSWYPDAA